ncbi:MAG: hypothetical protein ACXVCO_20235 [Ktedonobacterales bacterium]
MKLGFHINDYDWDGGAGRIGPTLAVIGFVPQVDRITPLEILGREVIPAIADL